MPYDDVVPTKNASKRRKMGALWGAMLSEGTEYVEQIGPRPGCSQAQSPSGDEAVEDVLPRKRRMTKGTKKTAALWSEQLLEEEKTETCCVPDRRESRDLVKEEWTAFDAMVDQGNHEVEVGVEAHEAMSHWKICTKNPGHPTFHPAPSFSLGHLPASIQDEDVLTFVRLWSKLITKVTTRYTSNHRPDGYPFHDCRGTSMPRVGTGKVTDIWPMDGTDCPCSECKSSAEPKKVWKAIWVMTALHVLYDDDEAIKTDVKLFYDDPNDRKKVCTLHGLRVVDSNVRGDWCKFECVTHDIAMVEELERADAPLMELGTKIRAKHSGTDAPRLAIIVSHPHGYAKQVTVGEWKERKCVENREENYEWTEYTYTADTCKGSSGAPVWILGPERVNYWSYYTHVHSEGLVNGVNKSGAGDVEKRWDWY